MSDPPVAKPDDDRLLTDEDRRANDCLTRHGVRIVRVNGVLELRGDLSRVQDAYLDSTCRPLISRPVADEIVVFQTGLGEQMSACLQQVGYDVPIDGATIHAEGVSGSDLEACARRVYDRYKEAPRPEAPA